MSFRDTMLRVADRLRARTGPDGFDIRPSRLSIVTRTWAAGRRGAPAPTPSSAAYVDVSLDLPQVYAVRQLSTREIASSGGTYETGDLLIGPITPAYQRLDGGQGGFSEAQLKPRVGRAGIEIIYRLSGAHAGDYQLVELRSTRPFRYELVIGRRETTP